MTRLLPLKAVVNTSRPLTYGIVQAGEDVEGGVPYIRPVDMNGHNGVSLQSLRRTDPAIARAYRRSSLEAGDIVVSIGPSFGKTMEVTDDLVGANLTQGTARVAPGPGADGRYLRWALQSHGATSFWEAMSGGSTFRALNLGPLGRTPIPMYSLVVQRAIADYLDRETAQLDAFIAKNEQLVTLLTERRRAVATQAVTRGINECASLKDSGFGWLGPIPEGWETIRVKFAVNSLPGFAFASDDFIDDSEATRLLRGVNVGVGTVSWGESVAVMNAPAEVERRYKLEEGDLVLGLDRPVIRGGLRVARIGQGDAGALLVQRVLRLRGTRVRNDFLEYALAFGGFAMYIEPDFTGVSVPHMSEQQVGDFRITLPSLLMQERITTHIREYHAVIDAALDAARRSVDLMRERRDALISAAVTGKVDVGVGA